MTRFLVTELLKLRRSLVLLLCATVPLCVAVICVLIGLETKGPVPLDRYWQTGAAFWAFAMLPMSVTALSVLMAQMEHGPRTWDHILAIPGARRRIFLAKAVVMLALVAAMTLLVGALLIAGAELLAALKPLASPLDRAALATTLWRMFLASGLMCVIQLWTALAFRSFVPPLLLGIMGTFVSVAAAAAREGAYFPWLMPLHILSTDPAMQRAALEIGALGGLAALVLMLLHLQHREAV
jgi:lantibiotic transport system permease protein